MSNKFKDGSFFEEVETAIGGMGSIPTTFDDLADGSTNKAFTATEKTKLSGIATGATANDTDANLKNRANHTGTQAASTISDFSTTARGLISGSNGINYNSGSGVIQPTYGTAANTVMQGNDNRLITVWSGTTVKTGASLYCTSATISSGTAVFHLTTDGTSGGTAIFPNGPLTASSNVWVSDETASYQAKVAFSNSNKTVTITANKLTTANILTGVLGQAQANSATVYYQVWGN